MPTVFAAVSITIFLFYFSTLAMAYLHALPVGLHVLWGLFTTTLLVLLQCLVFGFFIGSGKSMKRVVQENDLSSDWIQRTKDYKNKCYPPLMLAIVLATAAAVVGGGVSTQSLPLWVHQVLMWGALATNAWSFRVSYRVIVENVEAIHSINREIAAMGGKPPGAASLVVEEKPVSAAPKALPTPAYPKLYFFAVVIWVPYVYIKWSLGSRTFPFWPFLVLSGLFLVLGFVGQWRNSRHLHG